MSPEPAEVSATEVSATEVSATDVSAPDMTSMSYEAARDALAEVVRRLEAGASTLEEALALWERGELLAAHCESWLAGAQARLDPAVGGPARPAAEANSPAP